MLIQRWRGAGGRIRRRRRRRRRRWRWRWRPMVLGFATASKKNWIEGTINPNGGWRWRWRWQVESSATAPKKNWIEGAISPNGRWRWRWRWRCFLSQFGGVCIKEQFIQNCFPRSENTKSCLPTYAHTHTHTHTIHSHIHDIQFMHMYIYMHAWGPLSCLDRSGKGVLSRAHFLPPSLSSRLFLYYHALCRSHTPNIVSMLQKNWLHCHAFTLLFTFQNVATVSLSNMWEKISLCWSALYNHGFYIWTHSALDLNFVKSF